MMRKGKKGFITLEQSDSEVEPRDFTSELQIKLEVIQKDIISEILQEDDGAPEGGSGPPRSAPLPSYLSVEELEKSIGGDVGDGSGLGGGTTPRENPKKKVVFVVKDELR